MGNDCLHCGKPLGTRTTLCHQCGSAGVDVSTGDVDVSVRDRVERYPILASVRCSSCGEIHGTVTVDGEEYTAADFGVESTAEWETEMDERERWLRENREAVEAVLPSLESEWPQSVSALRSHVL